MSSPPPVYEYLARRYMFKHGLIATAVAFGFAEAWWRLYELPRRRQRDDYYRKLGVEWTHII